MISLHTAATPNGYKVSIMLEETGLPYRVEPVVLAEQQQKAPAFLAINPNGRIPAIVDHAAGNLPVFESGAILIYLARKAKRFLPTDLAGETAVMQWLMFQMSGVGPMMGQLNVFRRYMPEAIPLAIDRYDREVRRLFAVLDGRLAAVEHVAGADYSIADIALWPWIHNHRWAGVPLDDYQHLGRWYAAVGGRPAVIAGMQVPHARDPIAQQDQVVASGRAMLA
ncbi:MAG: glutathione S-transferase N-terminal domain-containing protein [Sphingomonas fennica]